MTTNTAKLPDYLMISECDGCLYDTRKSTWANHPPLRVNYSQGHREINSCADLKATLRNGSSTFPGCYPLYFITSDGAALSFDGVRKNLRHVLDSIKSNFSDGWRVVACDINYEDGELFCDQTGKRIPSAYAE